MNSNHLGDDSDQSILSDEVKGYFFVALMFFLATPFIALFFGNIVPWMKCGTEKAGQFGDTFGIANAAFSGLGFVMVVLTLRAQMRIDSRQRLIQQRQMFETTFLHLLNLPSDFADSVERAYDAPIISNFPIYFKSIHNESRVTPFYYPEFIKIHDKGKQESLIQYMRIFGSVATYIFDASPLSNREVYLDLLRSKLDDGELLHIYYCICGIPEFMPLARRLGPEFFMRLRSDQYAHESHKSWIVDHHFPDAFPS